MNSLKVPFTGLQKQYNNLRAEILDATDEVLRSGVLMNGNHTAEFENWLAKKNHTKYAVTCHSGTQALEIIASYLITTEFYPNPPRVLVPSVTYPATANAFLKAGWGIGIVDVDRNGLFDIKKIPELIDFQAVCLVGLYGSALEHLTLSKLWAADLGPQLGQEFFIEDAAQHWLADDCTRFGIAAAISFDPTKNLPAYGNGGAVVTDSWELCQYARQVRDNGKPTHSTVGTNSRMSELDCAMMMVKTRYLDQWQQRRADITKFWIDKFKGHPIRSLITKDNHGRHSHHKFVIEIEDRDQVQKDLKVRGIETKIHYERPLNEMSAFGAYPGPGMLSVGSALCRRVLSLPIYPELTDLAVEYVADQVLECVNNSGRLNNA